MPECACDIKVNECVGEWKLHEGTAEVFQWQNHYSWSLASPSITFTTDLHQPFFVTSIQ